MQNYKINQYIRYLTINLFKTTLYAINLLDYYFLFTFIFLYRKKFTINVKCSTEKVK